MEEYQISQGKRLRCGYTTGSCATAAAKAAAVMLLTGKRVDFVQIDTPKGIILNLEPEEAVITEMSVTCAIRKDSGDDPDDTNGILIYATVEKTAEKAGISDFQWKKIPAFFCCYYLLYLIYLSR